MEEFQVYEKYCQNKPRSESLWRQCSDCPFFQVCPGPVWALPHGQRLGGGQQLSKGAVVGTVLHSLTLGRRVTAV